MNSAEKYELLLRYSLDRLKSLQEIKAKLGEKYLDERFNALTEKLNGK